MTPHAPALPFADLGLAPPLLRALHDCGYHQPTPIQQQAIPHLLDGRDLLGIAQTGTGKTAAFALPLLQLLARHRSRPAPRAPRALVLTPTRELASQIADSFAAYGQHLPLRHTVIFGGVGQGPQVQTLRRGVDVLVATPGRLLDLISQRHVDLHKVEMFVLDEADRMLDMGFLPDVRRVIARLPRERHSLLFSATMPSDIAELAGSLLHDPVRVAVTPPASTVERIRQQVFLVERPDKRALLGEILADPAMERTLVFTRTKHGADRVARHLRKLDIEADALHGDKSQGARERALDAFRDGRLRVLVATDIAARGIDVPGITHVVNFDLPNVPESYVHRIGRTARAGRDGIALSFCDADERTWLGDIERLIRRRVEVVADHPFRSSVPFRQRPEARGTAPARGGRAQPAPAPAAQGRSGRRRRRHPHAQQPGERQRRPHRHARGW